jgi:hypothetical protein
MHRQTMRAGGERDAPQPADAWPRQVAPIAQHCDSIQIYGKLGGHGVSISLQRFYSRSGGN